MHLAILHNLKPTEEQELYKDAERFEAKRVVVRSTTMARIYISLGCRKIDFAMDVNQKWRRNGTPGIQGTDNEEITDSNLLLPQITKYHGVDTLTRD